MAANLRRDAALRVLLAGVLALSWPLPAFAGDTPEAAASRDVLGGLAGSPLSSTSGGSEVPEIGDLRDAGTEGATQVALGSGLNIYFIKVGQGDAEYIELPNGKNVLIDGGPPNSGSVTYPDPNDPPPPPLDPATMPDPPVAEFLTQHGVTKIDYLVLTHPHADHYSGLVYAFYRLQIDNFYDTRMNNSDATGDEVVRQQAKDEPGCKTFYPEAGDELAWDPNVRVQVFNGCPNPSASSDYGLQSGAAINNCSITLKLTYRGSSALFVGDIQEDVEATLAGKYGDKLKSDVLKVGHHGSKSSSSPAFLAKVQPKQAYIEVGRNNYGHPNANSVANLKAAGATVYRTDRNGTMEVALGRPSRRTNSDLQARAPGRP